jgi:hypothetical protein
MGLLLILAVVGLVGYFALIDKGYAGPHEDTDLADIPPWEGPSVDLAHGDLEVSADGRRIVHDDGTPFFFLADTAWQLFHKLTRDQVEWYLEDRRAKGFTVILASVMPDYHPLDAPNQYGQTTLIDLDPTRPNAEPGDETYDFWDHVDWVIDRAAQKGLYVGLLPTWGDKVVRLVGLGPEILDESNAAVYGRWIAQRYKDAANIIWVLGGDRSAKGHEGLWNAMAEAIRGVDPRHLMTYHPWTYRRFTYYPIWGGGTSASWFHDAGWLDFNMIQSGHWRYNRPNYRMISSLYAMTPTKPCIDGEPNYEGHAHQGCPTLWFRDTDVRKAAYWSLFAGAFGCVYGHHAIWQFAMPKYEKTGFPRQPRIDWDDAVHAPGSYHMRIVRSLMELIEYRQLLPDQGILATRPGRGRRHVQAARTPDGRYTLVYVPCAGRQVGVHADGPAPLTAQWFDPRTGRLIDALVTRRREVLRFTSPGRGPDWVLVLHSRR